MDFPYDGSYQRIYQECQYAAANALYEAMEFRVQIDNKGRMHY